MRPIDADELKKDLTRFYDNEVTAKQLIDEQPTIEPEQRWIPCSERLPEEYGEYLVTKHTIGWNCEEYDVNDIAYFDGDGFHKADRVIAWMPLPEIYQEGGQDG